MKGEFARGAVVRWQDVPEPRRHALNLAERLDITAPLNQDGERCPWPWEPQLLVNVAIGMYHCSYCGEMCIAGVEHPDFTGFDEDYAEYVRTHPNG